jgi:hypothetical protein
MPKANCISCKKHVSQTSLFRTNQVGDSEPNWMCEQCLKVKEPELHSNIKNDDDYKILSAILSTGFNADEIVIFDKK